MLSKTQNKYIRSLALQKFRKAHQSFVIEGEKIAREWLESNWPVEMILAVESWINTGSDLCKQHPEAQVIVVSEQELQQVSNLKEPNKVLLVARLPQQTPDTNFNNWTIALDAIRDPGNMGTILRIADWFGIGHVVCSSDCTDPFSPKVVQAAMGAHLRVQILETDLTRWLPRQSLPVLAAVLDGENVFGPGKTDKGILLIGNESSGISETLLAMASRKITIPRIGLAESLNAGVATGILCAALLNR